MSGKRQRDILSYLTGAAKGQEPPAQKTGISEGGCGPDSGERDSRVRLLHYGKNHNHDYFGQY